MSSELLAYLKLRISEGPCSLQELQKLFLPILEDLVVLHDQGLVSQDLFGQLEIKEGVFSLKSKEGVPIKHNPNYLLESFHPRFKIELLEDFKSQEIEAGQHDPLSEIFQFGLIFSALAFGLPLYDKETLNLFNYSNDYRSKLKKNHNPILLKLAYEMTSLDRSKRTYDLRDLSLKLQFAKELLEANTDFKAVLRSFKNSLFDFSKKSNILFKKDTKNYIQLHQSNVVNLSLDQLVMAFAKNDSIAFHPEENQKLYSQLKSLRSISVSDTKNIGFSNLKLALYNIHWCDLKNEEKTFQESPLFFLPVQLKQTKENLLQLEATSNVLETNPALLYALLSKYNISLPENLNLSSNTNILNLLKEASNKSNVPLQWQVLSANEPKFEDPFSWSLDENNIVLGNYNYKKISLAKDYDNIIENDLQSQSVISLISNAYDTKNSLEPCGFKLTDFFNIAPSDPYQNQAIIQARKGESFVIQGPPGTGKSQTISNIIADFVARDKKVLFISGKRAALDTVFEKLKASGIENISSLIYDAQNDKKAFVESLNKEYQNKVETILNLESIDNKRKSLVNGINEKIEFLSSTRHLSGAYIQDSKKTKLKDLYRIALKDVGSIEEINDSNPLYHTWEVYGNNYLLLCRKFEKANLSLPFNDHTFSCLSLKTWQKLSNQNSYEKDLLTIHSLGEKCLAILSKIRSFHLSLENIEDINKFDQELEIILNFNEEHPSDLLESSSSAYENFTQSKVVQRKLEIKLSILKEKNSKWLKKIPKEEIVNLLTYYNGNQGGALHLFNKSYRKNSSSIYANIRFPFFPSTNNMINALETLLEEYKLLDQIEKFNQQNLLVFGTADLAEISRRIKKVQTKISSTSISLFNKKVVDSKSLANLKSFNTNWAKLYDQLDYIKFDLKESLSKYVEIIKSLLKDVNNPPKIAQLVANLPDIFLSLRQNPAQVQKAFAMQTIEHYEKFVPEVKQKTHQNIVEKSKELNDLLLDFNQTNQHYIKAKQSDYFHQKLRLSSLSVSGLNAAEKEQRKNLMNGVKILGKEFSKSRNLKSIRELNESEAQQLIFDLKPVWLMSPLSVSEVLPLQESLFDLIIFDEASQIGIEEAIPAMYRTNQCIIVGDTMQMPPTTFFKKTMQTTELIKNHESILHFAEKNWPSIELLWHYRSKNDNLILFNNTVFYDGKLQTIPNRKERKNESSYVEIRSANDAAFTYEKVRENTLGFHYIKNGIFENRKNKKEADYIAALVKHLLLSKKDLNLGIITLSSEQETAITQAMHKLKYFDKDFDALLQDKAASQEIFQDLFVKNLENIQGEERDLIIVSIGYTYDAQSKFSNNFGPVNHQGGERRLNVLFSRAKRNLLLVSSIKHIDINNSFNRGVNGLKDYLEFAEKYSKNNNTNAITFGDYKEGPKELINDQLILGLKQAIEAKGYYVESNYGSSKFKIPLAIKKKASNKKYTLAILIDDASFYAQPVDFSCGGKAQILNDFGWQTYLVISKNWYYEKELILKEIYALIESETEKKKEKKERQAASLNAFDYQLSINDLLFTRLEKVGTPRKFWQIAGKLSDIVIQYGKVGSKGKTLIKSYANVAEVIKKKRSLIKGKEKKGYRRV